MQSLPVFGICDAQLCSQVNQLSLVATAQRPVILPNHSLQPLTVPMYTLHLLRGQLQPPRHLGRCQRHERILQGPVPLDALCQVLEGPDEDPAVRRGDTHRARRPEHGPARSGNRQCRSSRLVGCLCRGWLHRNAMLCLSRQASDGL